MYCINNLFTRSRAPYPRSFLNTIHQKTQRVAMSSIARALPQHNNNWYQSQFDPQHPTAKIALVEGKILGKDEKPHQMIERVINTIISAEEMYQGFYHQKMLPLQEFARQLGSLMDEGAIVLSTPILTNAGRFSHRPLSACAMPPVDLRGDLAGIRQIVDKYHQDGMGTGYDLSASHDPLAMLKYLNAIAVQGSQRDEEHRPVGNMATLDVRSPAIEQFITAKVGADARGEEWKFNISVNVSDDFMEAVKEDRTWTLLDGKTVSAKNIFEKMAYAAHQCGDPGLISIERMNQDNPTPLLGVYQTTAPCAEVGLAPGETCVFGYINLAQLVSQSEHPSMDFDRLKLATELLTRALDNLLEISIRRYAFSQSSTIMNAKRKIGIGVCGFADLLLALNLSYQQQEARDLLQDILNFINYHSKQASMELGKYRGAFGAILNSRYAEEDFIINKFATISTPHVTSGQWMKLANEIKQTLSLRHATTTALPPTGRSALVIGASTAIEPIFSFYTVDGIHPSLEALLQKRDLHTNAALIEKIKTTGRCPQTLRPAKNNPFVTATEISPQDHLAMSIAGQKVIDEALSKTVNLPEDSTPQSVEQIYMNAYEAGLKGVSIYRNKSRSYQPKKLSVAIDQSDKRGQTMNNFISDLVITAMQDQVQKLSVGAVVMHKGKLLVLKRRGDDFMPDIYELPGGGLEQDETLLDALGRELTEETGCQLNTVIGYVKHFDFPSSQGLLTRRFNFLVQMKTPHSIQLTEHENYQWIDPSDADRLRITAETRKIIDLVHYNTIHYFEPTNGSHL